MQFEYVFFTRKRFVGFVRYVEQHCRAAFRDRFEQVEHPLSMDFIETVAGFVEDEDERAFYRGA